MARAIGWWSCQPTTLSWSFSPVTASRWIVSIPTTGTCLPICDDYADSCNTKWGSLSQTMVERAAEPSVSLARRILLRSASALTTPLLPDDYIALMNPAWSTRGLTGTVVRIQPETSDASTVVVRPHFPWPGHRPGQYLRIGVEINGIRHWRAYSLT